MKKNYLTTLLISILFFNNLQSQVVRYVKSGSTGSGVSWQDASGDLQAMINASNNGDSVYVSEGLYVPTTKASDNVFEWLTNNPKGTTNDKAKAFVLKSGVKIYGGFSSVSPTTNLNLRNFELNETILSTDIAQNDNGFSELNTYNDNYYHTVIAAGITTEAKLDGFTIKGGTWSSSSDYDYILVNNSQVQQGYGAGIIIVDANVLIENIKMNKTGHPIYSKNSTATIKNLMLSNSFGVFEIHNSQCNIEKMNFSDNNGHLWVDALENLPNSLVHINNSTFARNQSSPSALRMTRTTTNNVTVNMDRVKFLGNNASSYGTIQNTGGDLKMSNTLASGNISNNQTGFLVVTTLNPSIITHVEITNCTIVSNKNNFDWFNNSGAILGSGANLDLKIRNSIIWGNKMGNNYSNISPFNNHPNVTIGNSIIQNAFDVNGIWDSNLGTNVGGNLGTAPDFTQYIPIVNTAFSNGDLSLIANSAGINEGNTSYYNAMIGPSFPLDVAGNSRIAGTNIDIGAFEYQEVLSTNELNKKSNIKIYPNPAQDYIKIYNVDNYMEYEIYNIIGQKALTGSFDAQSIKSISINSLATGTYIIKIKTKENTFSQKIIKK